MANSVLDRFKKHAQDSGSAPVQVIRLTELINSVTLHTKQHPKDFSSRRGLLQMVSKRKRFLEYVKRHDEALYKSLIKELNLRK